MTNIAVFCGANTGNKLEYIAATQQLARLFIKQGITLVYGGAKIGLMGVMADQMLALGGKVIGVIPDLLLEHEVAHKDITELHIVPTMHERKLLLIDKADHFIMLPGGAGSLDEFFEVMTLSYLGFHQKRFSILNVANYYDALIDFMNHSVNEGFLRAEVRDQMLVETDPRILLEKLLNENIETYQYTKISA